MTITTGERTGSATYRAIKLTGLAGLMSLAWDRRLNRR